MIKVLISFSVKIKNYHQKGNRYLEFDITLRKNGGIFYNTDGEGNVDETIRLVTNASAQVFCRATLSTTQGKETELQYYVAHKTFN